LRLYRRHGVKIRAILTDIQDESVLDPPLVRPARRRFEVTGAPSSLLLSDRSALRLLARW
jgi:hypothetical protein